MTKKTARQKAINILEHTIVSWVYIGLISAASYLLHWMLHARDFWDDLKDGYLGLQICLYFAFWIVTSLIIIVTRNYIDE